MRLRGRSAPVWFHSTSDSPAFVRLRSGSSERRRSGSSAAARSTVSRWAISRAIVAASKRSVRVIGPHVSPAVGGLDHDRRRGRTRRRPPDSTASWRGPPDRAPTRGGSAARQHLEHERSAAQVALGAQLLDQRLERERPGGRTPPAPRLHPSACSSRERRIRREIDAQHQGVDEEADQALDLGVRCGWRPGVPTTTSVWPRVAAQQGERSRRAGTMNRRHVLPPTGSGPPARSRSRESWRKWRWRPRWLRIAGRGRSTGSSATAARRQSRCVQ